MRLACIAISTPETAYVVEWLSASYPNSCSAIEYKLKGLLPESTRDVNGRHKVK